MTATEQYQMLRAMVPKWRAIATSTTTNKQQAEDAVRQLYRFYDRPEPLLMWSDNVYRLSADGIVGLPVYCHFRETLIFSIWHKLKDPAWVCSQIGYNWQDNRFQFAMNKPLLTSHSRITQNNGDRRRPAWLANTANMISQFDVDVLAIQELAQMAAIRQNDKLPEIINNIITACFAAILFEGSCLLIRKPELIMLNESHQLSAQGGPAFKAPNFRLYAMNGQTLSINDGPSTNARQFDYMTPRRRIAHIEYIGWEAYLAQMKAANRIMVVGNDGYGTLFRIHANNHIFLVVKVRNKTKEPDGTYRDYVIPIDQECRPLPDPRKPADRFGNPQILTPLNAVASTFGMTGSEYAKILGRES